MTSSAGLAFRRDGLVEFNLSACPGPPTAVAAVRQQAAALVTSPDAKAAAAQLLMAPPPRQPLAVGPGGRIQQPRISKTYLLQQPSPALWEWASDRDVCAVLEGLIGGVVTRPLAATVWLTLVPPPGWRPIMSQGWHRDPYDDGIPRILKLFWYLEAVGPGQGPFEYLRGTQEPTKPSGCLLDSRYIGERQPGVLSRRPERVVCTGPRDHLVLADTSGIHRGGWCQTAPRLSAVVAYRAAW